MNKTYHTVITGHSAGDWVEFYGDEAEKLAKACELTILTPKTVEGKTFKMAFFPIMFIGKLQREALEAGIVIILDLTEIKIHHEE